MQKVHELLVIIAAGGQFDRDMAMRKLNKDCCICLMSLNERSGGIQ